MPNAISVLRRNLVLGVALSALVPAGAFAQSAPSDTGDKGDKQASEIVVTGTLIRGIAPAGSQVISVSSAKVESLGVASTSEVLASLPQIGNMFNNMPAGVSGNTGANGSNPIDRPNLRNLPGGNTSGGAQTLVLLDGHRVVGVGTQQVAVDPAFIAPGVLERVEAMTDGGSAVYGSDALGGVINLIPRKRFDGINVGSHYSIGDDYHKVDASIMVGKDWGSGSAYIAYGYSHNRAVYGSDRKWSKGIDYATGIPVGRNCASPNITANGASYVVSGGSLVAGGPNSCDFTDNNAIYPEITNHNVFASLTQDVNDWIEFNTTVYYANRRNVGNGGAIGSGYAPGDTAATLTWTPSSAFYMPIAGDPTATQTIQLNYASIFGARSEIQRTNLSTWDITPSLTFKLGKKWQLRTLFNYGKGTVTTANNELNVAAQSAAIAAGALDPYNPSLSNQAYLGLLNGVARIDGYNEYYDYRAIADGPLIRLPGGEAHVAVGAEYMKDNFSTRSTNSNFVFNPMSHYTQTVKSVFGEVQVPIFGEENGFTLMRKLLFSASVRYDKYNDFGDTTNPKLGLTYKPVEWITFRGSWGKSFNAPSPTDELGPATAGAFPIPGAYLQWPGSVPGACGPGTATPNCAIAGATGVYLGGGSLNGLTPQTATNWSIGFEMQPPVVPGLTLKLSYYNIDLHGTIGRPVTSADLTSFYSQFPSLSVYRPTGEQLATYLASHLQNQGNVSFTVANPTSTTGLAMIDVGGTMMPVGLILDTLTRNLGETRLGGLDFGANFDHNTGFGSVYASVNGNYRLRQRTRVSSLAPWVDNLAADTPRYTISTSAGMNYGNITAQATWNYTAGFTLGTPVYEQTRLSSFSTVNLFFKYAFSGDGLKKDLAFTFNVDNAFDAHPPTLRNSALPGYTTNSGFSIGRVFQIGVSKKF